MFDAVQNKKLFEYFVVGATSVAFCYIALLRLPFLSAVDLLVMALASAVIGKVFSSFIRSPRRFILATWQRIIFIIWTPIAVLLMLMIIFFRIFMLLFKLSIGILIKLTIGIVYFLFPIDLIPDVLLGPGQIDDLLVMIGVVSWIISGTAMHSLRSSVASVRPTIDYP
jgi:hypothetical protein